MSLPPPDGDPTVVDVSPRFGAVVVVAAGTTVVVASGEVVGAVAGRVVVGAAGAVVVVGAAGAVVVDSTVVVAAGTVVVGSTVVVAAGTVVVGNTVVVAAGTVVVGNTVVVAAGTVVVGNTVVVAAGTVVVGNTVVGGSVVVGGGSSAQVGTVNLFVSSVTAAPCASAPRTLTPVVTVMEVLARMFPAKSLPVPRVAELPICQKTLHSCAPLMSVTTLFEAVVIVEAALKMKTELGSFPPSRTNVPVSKNVPSADAYTPAGSGPPSVPRSLGSITSTALAAAFVYAVPRSVWACIAAASLAGPTIAGGVTTPGGNPVMDVPGESPTLLSRMLRPVFVTVSSPRTE